MNFNETCARIVNARAPEDVFPDVTSLPELKKALRKLSAIVHPDANPQNQSDADMAFKRLTTWAHRADSKICAGTWRDGKPFAEFRFKTTLGVYSVFGLSRREALFDAIDAEVDGTPVLLHVARLTRYEMLADRAYRSLMHLKSKGFPSVLDVLRLKGRTAYVTDRIPDGFVPLSKIMEDNPTGVAVPVMLRFALSALALLADMSVEKSVHGAINPSSWWVHPETGRSYLADWHYSVWRGQVVEFQNETYAGMCPWEVRERKSTDRGTDLAALMIVLLEALGSRDIPTPLFDTVHEHLRENRMRPHDIDECRRKLRAVLAHG